MNEHGSVCQYPGCHTYDFLPFICKYCSQTYCLDHRQASHHECTSFQSSNQSHSHHSNNLSNNATKSSIDATNNQENNKNISVKSLFDKVENRFTNQDDQNSSKLHYQLKSSHQPSPDPSLSRTTEKLSKLDNISNDSDSHKQKKIANKTKEMLVKVKASGNDLIPIEDRFYMTCHFKLSNETRYLYFAKYHTVGQICQAIGNSFSWLVFLEVHKPDEMVAALETDDKPWSQWNRNNKIENEIDNFALIDIIPVPLEEVIIPQNQYLAQVVEAANVKFVKGEVVYYTTADGQEVKAKILDTHVDYSNGEYVYYTIKVENSDDNSVKQTIGERLKKYIPPPLPLSFTSPPPSTPANQESMPSQGHPYDDEEMNLGPDMIAIKLSKGGQLTRIVVPKGCRVGELKQQIEAKLNIPSKNLKLICKGKLINCNDRVLISDTPICHDCTIMVMTSSK